MPTSSITHNLVVSDISKFLQALEESEQDQYSKKESKGKLLNDSKEITKNLVKSRLCECEKN